MLLVPPAVVNHHTHGCLADVHDVSLLTGCLLFVISRVSVFLLLHTYWNIMFILQLHWLPIEWRIRFKLACLVHKILNTGHPPYLTELLKYHKPSRSTRPSASHLLSVPRHSLSYSARAFRVAAPKIWNSIPLHIRQSQTYSSFRRHLKTYYTVSVKKRPP